MKQLFGSLALVLACATLALPRLAIAQTSSAIPPAIITPDRLETSLGVLQFKDGAPSKETATKVYDYLDLMHGVEAFVNALRTGFGSLIAAAIFRATSRPSSVRTTCRSRRVAIDALRYRD